MVDTIWAVTCGDYSDYRVEAVFTTKAKAEAYLEGCNSSYIDFTIEEFALDPEPNQQVVAFKRSGDKLFSVHMDPYNGNCEIRETTLYVLSDAGYSSVKMEAWGWPYKTSPQSPRLHGVIRAKDEEGAAKIMNEYRVRFATEYNMEATIERARYKPPGGTVEQLMKALGK